MVNNDFHLLKGNLFIHFLPDTDSYMYRLNQHTPHSSVIFKYMYTTHTMYVQYMYIITRGTVV